MAMASTQRERGGTPASPTRIYIRRAFRESRRLAPRAWYTLNNLTRWAIIAVMFVFLLAMVIVLNEVRAFQDRVVEIVGDGKLARNAVMMLHRMEENPDAFPEDDTLPFAALAVQLDRILAAVDQLGRFGDFRSVADEDAAPEPAGEAVGEAGGQENAGGDGTGGVAERLAALKQTLDEETRKHFLEQRKDLTDNLADLHRQLIEAEPNIGVIEAMARVETTLGNLAAFATEETVEAEADDLFSEDAEPAVVFAAGMRVLEDQLDDLKRRIRLDVTNRPLVGDLESMTAAANRLHELRLESGLAITRGDGDGGGSGAGADAALKDDGAAKSGTQLIEDIGLAAGGLDRQLQLAFDDRYNAAREISTFLKVMRDEAGLLDGLEPADFDPPTNGFASSEAAEEHYVSTLGQLRESFRGLEQRLGERTRVVALAGVIRDGGIGETEAAAKASAILNDFDALDRFLVVLMPFGTFASEGEPGWHQHLGISPRYLATLNTESLDAIFIFMIGAIGSLLYIAKYYMGMALQGHWLWHRPTRPLSWLLFRPFFGVVVAFAIYLLVRAGQLAFGSNAEEGLGTDLNIPILSVVALLAGLLSWQALRTIESRGAVWFTERERKPLWATGLGNALRTDQVSTAECANQMGRSIEQIDRWTMYRDKVTVEMQDRLTTWLERNLDELFSDRRPAEEFGGKPMWATGLKRALEERDRRLDIRGLADLLHEDDVDRVRKWVELKLQVTPSVQWQLVDLLEIPHHRLFDHDYQEWSGWAIGLREAMRERNQTVYRLAQRLELADPVRLHRWKELDELVPARWQDDLVEKLDRSHGDLFEFGELAPGTMLHAPGLARAMATKGVTSEELARKVDVELERVGMWLRGEKQVAPATRRRIANELGVEESEIFAADPNAAPLPSGGAGTAGAGTGDAAGDPQGPSGDPKPEPKRPGRRSRKRPPDTADAGSEG